MFEHDFNHHRVSCNDPIAMREASGFLWNSKMMLHLNCRGYANAQFMQPEPAKYAHAPNIEGQTFMQPEQGYFSHHAGRFFYVKCLNTNQLFSLPYEPVKNRHQAYQFSQGQADITWQITCLNLEFTLTVTLPTDDVVELWSLSLRNIGDSTANIAIYPYFTIGYMSWMNQSANFHPALNGIVACSVTPYQKIDDYFKNQERHDKTFFLAKQQPYSWNANQSSVEGEGGLHAPDDILAQQLSKRQALYQQPVACLQFNHTLSPNETTEHQFVFGPAKSKQHIHQVKEKYLDQVHGFAVASKQYQGYISENKAVMSITTDDKTFDEFVNYWLPRQMFYHGDVNRLTTDPQTRNYLQDAMGMAYITPQKTKQALLTALRQQLSTGAMPDGILLHPDAELKYINQVPHSDHGVWLTLCLQCYLSETNDRDILFEPLEFGDCQQSEPLFHHINLALDYLLAARDERGLSYIEQGDWCDPMNMVGYKGKGVSAWLTMATAYALQVWLEICQLYRLNQDKQTTYQTAVTELNQAINEHFWDGNWYARGITDDDNAFGVASDGEGKIFLNAQSWAMLAKAADAEQKHKILKAVEQHLCTPYGVMMLAPAYTSMREDIGRITQKFPGVAENGSVYNHAAAFYLFSLLKVNKPDIANLVLKKMIPNQHDAQVRKQLPTFIPNYYRGAYYQLPDVAGSSSQLFNTGTVAWVYRCLVEEFFGLTGQGGKLAINPKFPANWQHAKVTRQFIGARFDVTYQRSNKVTETRVYLKNEQLVDNIVSDIVAGQHYQLLVLLPALAEQ